MNSFVCADGNRRNIVRGSALNGIDFLEVVDSGAPSPAERQRILRVHFLSSPPPAGLVPANVLIAGGDRIRGIAADRVSYDGDVVVVHLDAFGDFSSYRLKLAGAMGSAFDPASLDTEFSFIDFSFKVECPSEFDGRPAAGLSAPRTPAPHLDYLARDYASLRQMMLDRLSTLAPQWQERHAADVGVTLVELFAHAGDLLSYRQDAVATEAYIGTARRRISVRRHARLVDYFMHDGVNARAFLQIGTSADLVLPKGTQAFTALPGQPTRLVPDSPELAKARAMGPEIFETLHPAPLLQAHNLIIFHTFGNGRCRLPMGATSATLKGQLSQLKTGDILVLEEVLGPASGLPGEADPRHRHAVRLTHVSFRTDPLGGQFETPPTAAPTALTEIEWHKDDATPFAFQISAEIVANGIARQVSNITVLRGNVVLADHGATVAGEALGQVPPSGRFNPRLQGHPLVFTVPYAQDNPPRSARATLNTPARDALPSLALASPVDSQQPPQWLAQRDLLNSEAADTHFVAETENDGSVFLRFGDDIHGQQPGPGTSFAAIYRVGGGARGNVAADAVSHVVSADPGIVNIRNILPAQGGTEPESLEHVRRTAPFAFRSQRRAVTPDDYRTIVESHPMVQRAAATFKWTGSWTSVFITLDLFGGFDADEALKLEIRRFLAPFRLAGHDIEINGPDFVPLEIEMRVVAKPDYFVEDVKEALLQLFGAGFTPDGAKALFHPDNFTFGQPVYLSPLYAAVQTVDGVAFVEATTFQRRGRPDAAALGKGRLEMARLEIARLDNDPDFPERGVFRVKMEGGK